MRKLLASLLTAALLTLSFVPSAHAGGNRAGISMGLGLLIRAALGLAIATTAAIASPPYAAPIINPPPPQQWAPGHWQDQVVPITTRLDIWVPGHHDAYGDWTPSHYQTEIIPSGFTTTQVWVTGPME